MSPLCYHSSVQLTLKACKRIMPVLVSLTLPALKNIIRRTVVFKSYL